MQFQQQGDVLLKHVNELPENLDVLETITLAFGEATGHHHSLYGGKFDIFETKKEKQKYLRVVEPCELRHQEHKAFKVDPGIYKIDIVREYDHTQDEERSVID